MDVSAEMDFNFTKFFGFPSSARSIGKGRLVVKMKSP
jgi:hypothetical protein